MNKFKITTRFNPNPLSSNLRHSFVRKIQGHPSIIYPVVSNSCHKANSSHRADYIQEQWSNDCYTTGNSCLIHKPAFCSGSGYDWRIMQREVKKSPVSKVLLWLSHTFEWYQLWLQLKKTLSYQWKNYCQLSTMEVYQICAEEQDNETCWSSGQRAWLLLRKFGFESQHGIDRLTSALMRQPAHPQESHISIPYTSLRVNELLPPVRSRRLCAAYGHRLASLVAWQ